MEDRLSKGKAVQILRMSNDDSFTLEERQLEAILLDERVKDKHVAVVSVAGAYRQGKSFLLSFLLRFLWHQCHSNWLDDTSIPLGGFQWSPGSKRHTTGIQLWSQPFLVTTPQGDEVAVLLMDTQGSFDGTSSVKECTTIFALSIMTSSVQVYNIFRNIQEDNLQHLEFFSEYGKLAKKEARKCMFQRLVFLVRDWAFPYETEFGVEGGRTVLQDRLQIMDGQHADLQTLRRQINACFSKIECFLMPRPGEKVETDKSFDGYLEDIDGKFKEALKELVPWLLAPENLVVKEINGHKITCQELMNYFRVYAKAFQAGSLPQPKSVLQATAEASHSAAKEKSTRFYLEGMDKMPRGDLDRLRKAHAKLLNQATDLFRTAPKIGDESLSQSYLESLTKELQGHFDRLYRDEEQFLLREAEKEKQREKERQLERQKEEQREMERKREKEREQQLKRELQGQKEKEKANERQIEVLKEKLSALETDMLEQNRLAVAAEGLGVARSAFEFATEIVKVVPRP
ncbi:atlastin-1-like isoform X2 [Amblyomma americanum]